MSTEEENSCGRRHGADGQGAVSGQQQEQQHIDMCVNIGSQSTAPPRISASMSQATPPSPPHRFNLPASWLALLPSIWFARGASDKNVRHITHHRACRAPPASISVPSSFQVSCENSYLAPCLRGSRRQSGINATSDLQCLLHTSTPSPHRLRRQTSCLVTLNASSIDAMSDVCLPRETHDIDPSSPRAHAFTYAVLAADRPAGSASFCLLILSCPSPYLPFCGASQTPRNRSSHLAPFGARHIATGTPRDAPSCFGGLRIRWPSPLAPAPIPILNLPYHPPPLQARTEHRRSRTPDLDSLPWSPSRVQCHPGWSRTSRTGGRSLSCTWRPGGPPLSM